MTGENNIYVDIEYIDTNETIDVTWPIEDGRQALDLTAADLSMKIRPSRGSATVLLECTSGNGRLTAPAVGVIRLIIPGGSLSPTETEIVFDALYTLAGTSRNLWEGRIRKVREGIT